MPSLTCTLTHFSGYGAHDTDYDHLKYLIDSYSEYGQDFPGDAILQKLMSLAAQAAALGWNDLRDRAWMGAYPILDYLAGEAIQDAGRDPGHATLSVLIHYLDPAQAMGFTDIKNKLLKAINDVVVAVAKKGRELCLSGDEQQGGALLAQALEWASAGLVLETSTREQIADWLTECRGLEVILSADHGFVNTAAAHPGHLDACLLTFTVLVLDGHGEAVEGCSILLGWDGSGNWSGSTDVGGVFTKTISGSHMGMGPSPCPPHSYSGTFYAEASFGGKSYRSDDLTIEFKDIQITSTVSYSSSFILNEGEISETDYAAISGGGTGCSGQCSGTLTRSYEKVINNAWRSTAVDRLEIPACRFYAEYTYVQAGGGLTVAVLDKVCHYVCYMLDNIILETCDGTGECTTSGELDLYPLLLAGTFPFNCDTGVGGCLHIDNDGTGGFQYQWINNDGGPTWSLTAQFSITISVSF